MEFQDGVLPVEQFRQVENEYLELLKQSPALPSTAESATSILAKLNSLYDFFRRGGFYSQNEEIEEFSCSALRFLLLPHYIGRCHLLYQNATRPAHLESASAILTQFSDEMVRLGVIGKDSPFPRDAGDRRTRLIAEIQEKRALEARVQELNRRAERGAAIDEEDERTLIWTVLKLSAMESRSLARAATDELPFARMHASGVAPEAPSAPPPKMWVKKIDRADQMKRVFAPLEDVMPQPLPPDDETWAKPDVPGPREDASDDEEAEQARQERARWDDWKDRHPPFSGMDD
jgi:hypothetical protein